jgi:hypothetical protein
MITNKAFVLGIASNLHNYFRVCHRGESEYLNAIMGSQKSQRLLTIQE